VRWAVSYRASPRGRRIADRHYNRQKVGAPQFVPPGACLVLVTECGKALWITSWPLAEYVKHAWAGAWVCSAFRNEGAGLSSELIIEVRRKRDPGRCFLRAGFTRATRCGACHEETFSAEGLCPWCGAEAVPIGAQAALWEAAR